VTHTRTHIYVSFANPYLRCDQCGQPVPRWHDDARCGCNGGFWNEPCGHVAGVTSVCPSWSPVDGCCCLEHLGYVPHGPTVARGGDQDGR
jgi:hypothetical protein